MKRTISRFVRRISRQEEIDKLKLELEITNKQLAEEEQRGLRLVEEAARAEKLLITFKGTLSKDLNMPHVGSPIEIRGGIEALKQKVQKLEEALNEANDQIDSLVSVSRHEMSEVLTDLFEFIKAQDDKFLLHLLPALTQEYRHERDLDKGEKAKALDNMSKNMSKVMGVFTPGMF